MSYGRNHHSQQQGSTIHDDRWSSFSRNNYNDRNRSMNLHRNNNYNHNWSCNNEYPGKYGDHTSNYNNNYVNRPPNGAPSLKRRKYSSDTWGDVAAHFVQPIMHFESAVPSNYNISAPPTRSNAEISTISGWKRERSIWDDDEPVFMSRDEMERHSPSRKDGIDALQETHLRYSYCEFLQNLGMHLELPQTTVGTSMVLCHRFFVRRSHACHDRFLIATAALFLAAKSEETPRPLNDVVRASCEIFHKQDLTFLSYLLPVDWFEQYRERVTEAEQMILTTLNFELNVQHPYAPLTSVLDKLGFSQSVLVNLALNLVSEGLRSSLWLQFKPHHIAAGAVYLAAKFLHVDIVYQHIWHEFQTTPAIIQDVAQQLMELF